MSPSGSPNVLAAFSTQLAAAVEDAATSVVAIHARRRIPSSGIVWRDGVIISASHTVRRDGEVPVTLPSGESTTATVAGRDAATDLIALRVTGETPRVAPRGDPHAVRVGSVVLAVGRPGRHATATVGFISAVIDDWRTWQGARVDRVLRLDLAVADGFSGGPLVDASGGVIGIDNSALARGTPTALPAAAVDHVLDELLEHGHVRRPYLGIVVHPVALGRTVVKKHALGEATALMVMTVAEDGPAEAAGILVGDALIELNGHALRRPTDLLDTLSSARQGKALTLTVLRGDALISVSVTPGDREGASGPDE